MPTTITLYAAHLTAAQLKLALEAHGADVPLELRPNPTPDRSGLDPDVVVALIGLGGTVLAALIGLFGVLYVANRKEEKAEQRQQEMLVLIKTQEQRIDRLVAAIGEQRAREVTETSAGEDVFDRLVLPATAAATIEAADNPYHQLFAAVDPAAVELVALIEDA